MPGKSRIGRPWIGTLQAQNHRNNPSACAREEKVRGRLRTSAGLVLVKVFWKRQALYLKIVSRILRILGILIVDFPSLPSFDLISFLLFTRDKKPLQHEFLHGIQCHGAGVDDPSCIADHRFRIQVAMAIFAKGY